MKKSEVLNEVATVVILSLFLQAASFKTMKVDPRILVSNRTPLITPPDNFIREEELKRIGKVHEENITNRFGLPAASLKKRFAQEQEPNPFAPQVKKPRNRWGVIPPFYVVSHERSFHQVRNAHRL